MNTVDILKAAKELIGVPERWTKGESARDENGKPTTQEKVRP